MESSREGVPKKLNGHGKGLKGQPAEASEADTSQAELSSLVEELARAMNMARENLDRPQPKATASVSSNPLPAMPPPRGLFDDEDDDAAMPIPSTWRTPPEPPKSGTLRDQARAAAMGFVTGLAIVVPVVLYLTGRLDYLPLDALFGGGPDTEVAVHSAAAPSPSAVPLQVQQRTVPTTIITATEAAAVIPAAAVPPEPSVREETQVDPPKPSWADTIAEGKARILAGDILEGREILTPAAEANEPEALMALAETYDPNMLAAWGVRDVTADVAKARELYQRAARAGIETARVRLNGLN